LHYTPKAVILTAEEVANRKAWDMGKKTFLLLLLGAVVILSAVPALMYHRAEEAFFNPKEPGADDNVKNYIMICMGSMLFKNARVSAERAVIYFPESKNMDYFLLCAGKCAEHEGKKEAAAYWYNKFVRDFPNHNERGAVTERLIKLKDLEPQKK
jgi:hypothetical protein